MIRVELKVASSIGRFELEDYIRLVDLSVLGYTEDGEQVILGKIAAEQLLLLKADYDNADLFSICDNNSGEMLDLFSVLFDTEYRFQPEFQVDLPTVDVVFFGNVILHPSLTPFHSAIIQTICELFGHESAIVMKRNDCKLSDKELADLRFAKIAGTEFVFRHTGFQCEFSIVNPQGIEVPDDFAVDLEAEEWVLERWDAEPY